MPCKSLMRAGAIGAMGMGLLIGQASTVTARPSTMDRHLQSHRNDSSSPQTPSTAPKTDSDSATVPSATHADGPQITPWQTLTVEPGDSLSRVFAKVGLSARDWRPLLKLGDAVTPLKTLRAGETLDIRKTTDGRLSQLQYPIDAVNTLSVERSGTDNAFTAQIMHRKSQTRRIAASGEVDGSLSRSLATAGVPARVATEMAHIYRYRANLSRNMHPGDHFSVIYEAEYVDGKRVAAGPIIAAAITTGGVNRKAFRALSADGKPGYYDASGHSYMPSFSRRPVSYSRISSPFNPNRMHPILHIRRPHWGVDMAAPRGTPIHAAADGTVKFVGSKHGYGRLVELDHFDGFSTRYGHMYKFVKGLHDGEHVTKGQVIGYVGSTGEATGPHLHFEIRRNGVAHNPLTMPLPEGHPLSARRLALFTNRIQPLIARLDESTGTPNTLIASNTGQLRRTNCSRASVINAALALSPAHANNQNALANLFCVVAADGSA